MTLFGDNMEQKLFQAAKVFMGRKLGDIIC